MTPKLLLVAISAIALVGNAINADRAIAQAKPPDQSQPKPSDQSQAKPSDQSQPTRPRVTFFEQEQKFGKDDSLTFGNENFLQSALSGTTMAIEDPAKLRPSGVINFNGGNISSGSSSTAVGTYSVGVTETFSSRNGSITFSSVSPTSALNATGSVNVNGSINGQSLTGNYNYIRLNALIVNSNFSYYPASQLTNPSQSLVFKILAQPVQTGGGTGFGNLSAPASVSIGIPRDR
ncbi:MAG: hypothetical protein M1G31_25565 [Pseudanabaena sp. Salubria-1]|nr:hypothetical protein [Pseudanabaena sp. Salubria-1]